MTTQALNIIRASFCFFADFAAAPLEFSQRVPNPRPVRSGRFPADIFVAFGGGPGAGRTVRVGRVLSPRAGVKRSWASGGRV